MERVRPYRITPKNVFAMFHDRMIFVVGLLAVRSFISFSLNNIIIIDLPT